MKALTLTEPWATLMRLEEKRVETRSWKLPNYIIGQEVAIHSAKGYPKWAQDMCNLPQFHSSLRPDGNYAYPELHRGHVLCVVKFIGCRFTEDVRNQISDKEMAFGDYEDGRFAWFSEFVTKIDTPIPAVGHLGFWDLAVSPSDGGQR